jgi:hypothetical protein
VRRPGDEGRVAARGAVERLHIRERVGPWAITFKHDKPYYRKTQGKVARYHLTR